MNALPSNEPIVLASASSRRKSLLAQIVPRFSVDIADIDETPIDGENGPELVARLAQGKAKYVTKNHAKNTIIIGADTVVAINQRVLGKPVNYEHFCEMMNVLSGQIHQVFTGICVTKNQQLHAAVVCTHVQMTDISPLDAKQYWRTNEPIDKAGGYAIQGIGGQYVKSIDGSYSAVVGLPLFETKQLLSLIK